MAITANAKDSLLSFLIGCGVVSIYILGSIPSIASIPSLEYLAISFLAYSIIINVVFLFIYQFGCSRYQASGNCACAQRPSAQNIFVPLLEILLEQHF
jgi:hypothetical protein